MLEPEVILNVTPFLVKEVPPPVSTVGSKTTVPADAAPQTNVNKDSHTNRNALLIMIFLWGSSSESPFPEGEEAETRRLYPG